MFYAIWHRRRQIKIRDVEDQEMKIIQKSEHERGRN